MNMFVCARGSTQDREDADKFRVLREFRQYAIRVLTSVSAATASAHLGSAAVVYYVEYCRCLFVSSKDEISHVWRSHMQHSCAPYRSHVEDDGA